MVSMYTVHLIGIFAYNIIMVYNIIYYIIYIYSLCRVPTYRSLLDGYRL